MIGGARPRFYAKMQEHRAPRRASGVRTLRKFLPALAKNINGRLCVFPEILRKRHAFPPRARDYPYEY